MLALSLPLATTYLIAFVFGVAGTAQLAGIGMVRRAYLRWDYPPRVFRLTGAMELLAAFLLLTPSGHSAGVALAAAVNFIAVALLLKNSAYFLALPGMAVMALLPITLLPMH